MNGVLNAQEELGFNKILLQLQQEFHVMKHQLGMAKHVYGM
jgi:hypothetical protein